MSRPTLVAVGCRIGSTCQGESPNARSASRFKSQAARFQGRAGGAHVVYNQYAPAAYDEAIVLLPFGELGRGCGCKSALHVFTPLGGIKAHLRPGMAHPSQHCRTHRYANHTTKCPREQVGLIVSPFALARRVQRHSGDQINRDRIRLPVIGHQASQRRQHSPAARIGSPHSWQTGGDTGGKSRQQASQSRMPGLWQTRQRGGNTKSRRACPAWRRSVASEASGNSSPRCWLPRPNGVGPPAGQVCTVSWSPIAVPVVWMTPTGISKP
jgi:hypothetical protein